MPVRTGLCVRLYVTVMIATFTKCLSSGQYAINTLECITRNNRVTHVMQYSLNVQNIEGCVDTCGGCRIVEYLLSTVFLLCIGLRPRVRAFYYNNINRQMALRTLKRFTYRSIRRGARGFCDCWKLTFYAANI